MKPKREPEIFAARSMSKRPISVCSFGLSSCGGSPQRLISTASSSVIAVGGRLVRRVRHLRDRRVACLLGLGELRLELLSARLHVLHRLDLLRRRLALELLLRAQLVGLRHELAPAGVGGQQLVERLARAAALERGANASGSLRAALRSIIGVSLGRPRSPVRRLPPSSRGQTKSATASTRSCAFATAIA